MGVSPYIVTGTGVIILVVVMYVLQYRQHFRHSPERRAAMILANMHLIAHTPPAPPPTIYEAWLTSSAEDPIAPTRWECINPIGAYQQGEEKGTMVSVLIAMPRRVQRPSHEDPTAEKAGSCFEQPLPVLEIGLLKVS